MRNIYFPSYQIFLHFLSVEPTFRNVIITNTAALVIRLAIHCTFILKNMLEWANLNWKIFALQPNASN